MVPISKHKAISRVADRLAELLEINATGPIVYEEQGPSQADAVLRIGPFVFVVEWVSSGTPAKVANGADSVFRRAREQGEGAIPLVAAPFVSESGRRLCTQVRQKPGTRNSFSE